MIKANVVVDFPKWKKKIRNPDKYIQIKIKKLNKIHSFINKKQEFSILLTNKSKMKNLNYKFRKKNKSTDVLSFPLNNRLRNDIYIGDIAIGFEFVDKKSDISKFQYFICQCKLKAPCPKQAVIKVIAKQVTQVLVTKDLRLPL